MKELNRIKVEKRPESIQILSNNSYYYNFDIQPCKFIQYTENHSEKEINGWSYIPIYIVGTPEYKNCVKAVIRTYISLDEEFDLINSFNKSIAYRNIDSKDKDKYFEYLTLIDTIKESTKKIFNIK